MKCAHCGEMVVYCGHPWPHFTDTIFVHNAAAPFLPHGETGAFQLPCRQFVVPMYDGALVLCMHLNNN